MSINNMKETLAAFKQKLLDALLEEACRQWFCFIDDSPERSDAVGFADFHREIIALKVEEYAAEISEIMNCEKYDSVIDEILSQNGIETEIQQDQENGIVVME